MRNFKDESFIGQYLSPKLMRDLRLFAIRDDEKKRARGRGHPRRRRLPARARGAVAPVRPGLARAQHPGLERQPARRPLLTLRHFQHNDRPLHDSAQEVLKHVARLWGFGVHLESANGKGDVTKRWTVNPAPQ
jgi:stage V sporulation protein R